MYKAMTKNGQIVKNSITDINKENCIKRLKENDLMPISLTQTFKMMDRTEKKPRNFRKVNDELRKIRSQRTQNGKKNLHRLTLREKIKDKIDSKKKITSKDIRVFTQSFYLLKKAKFNNVHALSTVLESTENPKLKLIVEDILYGVEAGEYMHTTMEYYADIFPYIYINMIKVGELSGSLELALSQAIKYLDESEALNTKLKRILIPNIALLIGTVLLLFVCIIVGLPVVQNIFESVGTKDRLPWITIWFAGVVDTLIAFWYVPVLIVAGITIGTIMYVRTPQGRYRFDKFKYTMPVFGKLIYLVDFSRLLKNMLLNIQNGIRIQDALEVSKNVVNNTVMLSIVNDSINNIYVGKSWIAPFENERFSNSMTVEMLKIGMQTDLTEMMEKLVEYMDIDIDNTLNRIMKILPEIAGGLVGVVLIFFVLVVLVPVVQIYMGGFLFSAYQDYI